jgi:hypothetical protein
VLADVIRLLPTRCGYSGSTVLLCHGYLPDTCWIYTRICCGYLRVFSRVCRVSTRKSGIYPPLVFIPHACILAITTVTVYLPFIKQRTKPRQVCRVLTRNHIYMHQGLNIFPWHALSHFWQAELITCKQAASSHSIFGILTLTFRECCYIIMIVQTGTHDASAVRQPLLPRSFSNFLCMHCRTSAEYFVRRSQTSTLER